MNSFLSFRRRIFYSLLSACLVWFSFPNFLDKNLTPFTAFLGWIALVPLFLAMKGVRPRQGAVLGWVFGFVQFGGILYWIAFLEEAKNLSGLAWLTLVFYLSLFSLVFGWIYCFLVERLKVSGCWIAPFIWVGLEYIRGSRPWGGFPWGELGYSQAPYPALLTFTSFAGVYGLTFLMVWFNACLAKAYHRNPARTVAGESQQPSFSIGRVRWIYGGLPLVVLFLVWLFGIIEIKSTPLRNAGTVVLLQPGMDQSMKWDKANEIATYDRIEKLVKRAKVPHPSLVVWPETGAPSYLLWSPRALARVVSIVRNSQAPHLVGCLDAVRGRDKILHSYNAAVHFTEKGQPVGAYHKRHRVPFGEFVPFQKYLTFLGPVVGDLGNFDAGEEYKKFQADGFSYSPMICYEVIFPDDVREAFVSNAEALVNISNDAWYGRTASAYQHAMMAVVGAAEVRKPLLRSANTGISLATDPFGRLLVSSPLFAEMTVTADVMLASSSPTLYSKWGNWLPRVCWLVGMILFLAAFRRKKVIEAVASVS